MLNLVNNEGCRRLGACRLVWGNEEWLTISELKEVIRAELS
jgi:hypothetical protein